MRLAGDGNGRAVLYYGRGGLLLILTVLLILAELLGKPPLRVWAGAVSIVYLATVFFEVRWSRRAFVGIGVVLSGIALATRDDGLSLIGEALAAGGFVAGFFVALATLRTAAGTSEGIRRCGEYLATRTPTKRYFALAMGGHLFSLVLNYGAISLLGSLVERAEIGPDGLMRNHVRLRRMLLAVQRGFVSTLCWSPLAFSIAVGTTVIAGSSWEGSIGYGLASAVLLGVLGWVLDVAFKPPRPVSAPPPPPPVGDWRALAPLLGLLFAIIAAGGAVRLATGMRTTVTVMAVVPVISFAWIAAQTLRPATPEARVPSVAAEVGRRFLDYVGRELDSYKSELVLLIMAGVIGKLGGGLAAPLVAEHLVDFTAVPTWAILLMMVWGLPIAGQLGMHPILAVSLVGPLLPTPEALGIPPDLLLNAICVGWAFTAATSPFTATVLLVAVLGRVGALTVGLKWNGLYLASGCILGSIWVLCLDALMS